MSDIPEAWREHLRSAGAKGGRAATPAQRLARLRGLLKRWPHSASIRMQVEVLEQELKLAPGQAIRK